MVNRLVSMDVTPMSDEDAQLINSANGNPSVNSKGKEILQNEPTNSYARKPKFSDDELKKITVNITQTPMKKLIFDAPAIASSVHNSGQFFKREECSEYMKIDSSNEVDESSVAKNKDEEKYSVAGEQRIIRNYESAGQSEHNLRKNLD